MTVAGPDGHQRTLAYDQLIVATGADPVRPAIPGLELEGLHVLHTMADSFAVQEAITTRGPRSAVIIGGGYIGLEMAEALTARGLEVTQVEQLPTVLPTVDGELGRLLAGKLERHGVRLVNQVTVTAIQRDRDAGLRVVGEPGFVA